MHPEIVRSAPGSCPICGMALEPVSGGRGGERNPELEDMTRRFWVSALLDAAGLRDRDGARCCRGCAARMVAPRERGPGSSSRSATPVVLWGGWPFFVRGWASLRTRRLNMFTLIAIGTGAAWLYSASPPSRRESSRPRSAARADDVAVYFEAAAVIVTLVLLGQVLELRARSQTGAAIRALLGLAPKTARRVEADGSEEDVPLEHVAGGRPACACGPARRCRSTASCSRARAPSTSRC